MAAYTHTTTRISRVLAGLAVLWGIIGLAGIESRADDGELARATLRGVEGVRVVVEELRPEVERTGLSRQQLQTDVELRLRKAGIRVLTKEERVPGRPWLYVNANVTVGASGIIAYQIDVGLRQNARLETDDSFAIAITWTYSTGMWVASTPTHVRNLVQDGVDHFINAYLSVHPRPAGSAISSSASPGVTLSARSRNAYRPWATTLARLMVPWDRRPRMPSSGSRTPRAYGLPGISMNLRSMLWAYSKSSACQH